MLLPPSHRKTVLGSWERDGLGWCFFTSNIYLFSGLLHISKCIHIMRNHVFILFFSANLFSFQFNLIVDKFVILQLSYAVRSNRSTSSSDGLFGIKKNCTKQIIGDNFLSHIWNLIICWSKISIPHNIRNFFTI